LNHDVYQRYLLNSIDLDLFELTPESFEINAQFKSLKKWIKCFVGPATAEFHQLNSKKHLAIKDENRNAILPEFSIEIQGKMFYLSVKGCGAYEDMFFGSNLNKDNLKNACRDLSLLNRIEKLSTGQGFIMAESWMGESPYGAQGYVNAFDELKFSKIAQYDSINGAYICPVIGVVQLPKNIEEIARNFFWCRTYNDHFYQELRLVPSNVRLYFESFHTVAKPKAIFNLFNLNSSELIEEFELQFIKSGIALLSLFTRSANITDNQISGIVYQDVWFDKDCIVAPDGTIHFADLEGLIWKTVPKNKFAEIQKNEWQKLVFEFLFALIKIDSYRLKIDGRSLSWSKQREELSLLIQLALNNDIYAYPKYHNNNLLIVLEGPSIPSIEIPLIEKVKCS